MSEARQDLSIGIVGLGAVAGAHIEAFQAVTGANITAVSSRRSLNEAELAAKYGQPLRPVSSYDELLADSDIDTVDICTPHHLHTEQAIAAYLRDPQRDAAGRERTRQRQVGSCDGRAAHRVAQALAQVLN